jgi:hypothetical protein
VGHCRGRLFGAAKRILKKNKTIEKGPQRTGGFQLGKQRRSRSDIAPGDELLLRTDWEKKAVARLSELLQESSLGELLGDLRHTVRQARKAATGVDRPSRVNELATALLLQHGIDLFCEPEVRRAVAKAAKVACPGRWHPGKTAALEFVAATTFPDELAGKATEDSLPDYEFLEGRFGLKSYGSFRRK